MPCTVFGILPKFVCLLPPEVWASLWKNKNSTNTRRKKKRCIFYNYSFNPHLSPPELKS